MLPPPHTLVRFVLPFYPEKGKAKYPQLQAEAWVCIRKGQWRQHLLQGRGRAALPGHSNAEASFGVGALDHERLSHKRCFSRDQDFIFLTVNEKKEKI